MNNCHHIKTRSAGLKKKTTANGYSDYTWSKNASHTKNDPYAMSLKETTFDLILLKSE